MGARNQTNKSCSFGQTQNRLGNLSVYNCVRDCDYTYSFYVSISKIYLHLHRGYADLHLYFFHRSFKMA